MYQRGTSISKFENSYKINPIDSDDCYCESGPDDTISQIRFSNVPKIEDDPEFISASSWDSTIRVWEINHSYRKLQTKFMADFNFDAPVLGQCWMDDNSWILGAWADNTVKAWNLAGNKLNTVAKHASAAKDVYYDLYNKIIISSGFDGHLMFWDERDSKPVFDINFEPFKIWSLSFADPLLVGALSNNSLFIYNIDTI